MEFEFDWEWYGVQGLDFFIIFQVVDHAGQTLPSSLLQTSENEGRKHKRQAGAQLESHRSLHKESNLSQKVPHLEAKLFLCSGEAENCDTDAAQRIQTCPGGVGDSVKISSDKHDCPAFRFASRELRNRDENDCSIRVNTYLLNQLFKLSFVCMI